MSMNDVSKGGGGGSRSQIMSSGPNERVIVNIYDMYTMNDYTSAIGIGIYHCGVEVYGVEYGYGGHPFPFSGVFEMTPRDTQELGEAFRFKESVEIGRTDFTKSEIDQIVQLIGREFRGIDYHLINKNCNTFSSKFAKTICGEDIPSWVNRLAYISTYIPFIERMIPREWISPVAIQHTLESHMNETANAAASASSSELQSSKSNNTNSNNNNNSASNGNIWSYIFNGLSINEQPSTSSSSTSSSNTSPQQSNGSTK